MSTMSEAVFFSQVRDQNASSSCGESLWPVEQLICYYILKPTLVKKLIYILRQEHPAKERERKTIIREAKHRTETFSQEKPG